MRERSPCRYQNLLESSSSSSSSVDTNKHTNEQNIKSTVRHLFIGIWYVTEVAF